MRVEARVDQIESVRGWTETVRIGDLETAETIVLLVPGNPGNPRFYIQFMARLCELAASGGGSSGKLAGAVVGHLGHSRRSQPPGGCGVLPHSYADQIAHKIEFMAYLQAAYPRARLVLAGHSIGAHCMLAMYQHRLCHRARVAGCLGLMPTVLHIVATPNGATHYPLLLYCRRSIGLLAGLLGRLPRAVQLGLLALRFGARLSAATSIEVLPTQHCESLWRRANCRAVCAPLVNECFSSGLEQMWHTKNTTPPTCS